MARDADNQGVVDVRGLRIGVAVSGYHGAVTGRLLSGAIEAWLAMGGSEEDLLVARAPGSWELVALCRAFAGRGDVNAAVALGLVMRGATPHFEYICQGVTAGLAQITAESGMPIGFGLLTCDSEGQALARSGGAEGNKGAEAMRAAAATAAEVRLISPDLTDDEVAEAMQYVNEIEWEEPAGAESTGGGRRGAGARKGEAKGGGGKKKKKSRARMSKRP